MAPPGRARVLRGKDAEAAGAAALSSDLGKGRNEFSGMVDPALVERVLNEAREEGFQTGYAEGLARAEGAADAAGREAERRIQSAMAALMSGAGAFAQRQATALADIEDEVAALAFELATALIGRELASAQNPGRDAVARALGLAPHRVDVIIRLHPDDAALVPDPAELAPGRGVTMVADPGVERGGCVLDAGGAHVDAQLGPALERVRAALDVPVPVAARALAAMDGVPQRPPVPAAQTPAAPEPGP
jgi:flagellar assembly protein FliH